MFGESRERAQVRAGAAGEIAKAALGIDWYDTESQARRVAQYAQIQIGLAKDREQNLMNALANLRHEMKKLEAELAASEANLAALQARWDARPSAASYDGLLATISEAAAQDAGVIATLEARVVRLADALETAYRHLDLSALRVSHAVDARVIENGFKSLRVTDSANVQQGKQK